MLPNNTLEIFIKILVKHCALEISTIIVSEIKIYVKTYIKMYTHALYNLCHSQKTSKIIFVTTHNLNLDETKFSLKYIRTKN